jgi:hypothetical protein
MKRPKKNPVREDRIQNEAIVDAYGPEEQALGWYYYLENKIRFPFQAQCIRVTAASPLRKGETIEVRRLAPEDSCDSDMLVLIHWQDRNVAVPLSQLIPLDPMNPPPRPSATGIIGWRRATASESPLSPCPNLRKPAETLRNIVPFTFPWLGENP